MNEVDYEDLYRMFFIRGYKWKMDGQLVVPTIDDLKKTVNKAVALLDKEPVGSSLEVGRLLVRKTPSGYDVFAMIGETNAVTDVSV